MISTELARALAAAGLPWHPSAGDRFRIVSAPDLEDDVFTLSEMTIEARHYPTGTILGFNGTTEWALDSVAIEDALWMPREDQLRELLGATFRSLTRDDDGFHVTAVHPLRDESQTFSAPGAADAYAQAVLALVELAEVRT
ncbi:conserved hypothetical protein [Beutenbergia cavernae DSM 12333]|uniref:Pilus assembly protein CpaE n=1 Tax=Beutenbergia cavernae (strain ATCC BAA-8 / DSM 12333 / CCUG 43141 / JCM 11478 / NBRC 16432 / NCIMB 13614 / HKI 0122) TaxID=471853 RepID=C5C2E9_BEUC1|nr:hypothetical protein [Beutenbergia cavernae]ACQ79635.1 conserved hypothetical protein [Beutenbergia cavernae DSM 12333]